MGKESFTFLLIFSFLLWYGFETGNCLPELENFLDSIYTNVGRSISVSSTCSNNSAYVKYPDTGDPSEYSCITDEHSSLFMHDDDPGFTTYWQSEISSKSLGNFTEQWIVLNLTDTFLVRSVLIAFTSPLVASGVLSDVRPNALVIERWLSEQQGYQPWRYYSSNCVNTFPQVLYQPINGPSPPPAVAVCKEQYYSGDTSTTEPDKPHQFVLYSPFTDISTDYHMNKTELDFHSTSAVRIRLVRPAAQTPLASYYTVSSFQVNGSCLCYGHADACVGQNKAVCGCIHNTAGDQCDRCLPLYNSAPWQVYNQPNNFSCIRCDCNNNTESCVFNDTLSGPVCVGCHGNSYGDRCERCEDGFYNIGSLDGDTVCTECQCTGDGLLNATTSCNSSTGQCNCKSHVTGLSCDQCQDGFWNLTRDNTYGCQECSHCNTAGTVGELPMCHVITGQCECKTNVIGQDCSFCSPLTFNLSATNQDGCTKCACIEGASLNSSCELLAGNQCLCVEHVGGRTCDTPLPGYFIPKLDYIRLHSAQAGTVMVPATGEYIISLSSPSASIFLSALNATSAACGAMEGQHLTDKARVCLELGVVYSINSTDNATAAFIPILSDVFNTTEGKSCLHQVLDGVELRSSFCAAIEYSVMAAVYSSALECQCDVIGSYEPDRCDPLSGQCHCRPGVTGYSCDVCMINHYNISEHGCTACNCDPSGSMELPCDEETGDCKCHPYVSGEKCDRCQSQYYGHSSGEGCTPCECSVYSLDNNCSGDGVCACTTGVGDDTCQQCLDGYHSLSEEGCIPCNCSEVGSVNNTCLSPAGTCTCKPFVYGDKCDTCAPGFHQLWHADMPCKVCYCYGHALQCSTQHGWSKSTISDRWSMFNDSVLQPRWTVIDKDGNELPSSLELYHSDEDVRQLTVYTADGSNMGGLAYFSATRRYLGDQRASYYQHLVFTLSCRLVSSLSPLQVRVVLRGHNIGFELWSQPLRAPDEVPTVYRLRISELELIRNDTLRRAPLPELLQLLNNLTELLIPASFDQVAGSACVLHSVAMETGVRDFDSGSHQLSNIEQCHCPAGYEGAQCESCAEGYRRHPAGNDSPTSDCVPCDCSSQSCDPVTGLCYCGGHSTGSRCETCLPGFYGRPAQHEMCRECICYGTSNNTCVSEVDGLPTCLGCSSGHTGRRCQSCLSGYYGNPPAGIACEPCHCNGRSDECDETGVCIGCEANTTGSDCELCAAGFYGNASISCSECSCVDAGYEQVCHSVTGACHCLPGLDITSNCTRCLPGHHNQSSAGCLPCSCDAAGSLEGSVCNTTTGQCVCRNNIIGLDCSLCASGYFSHGDGCVACGCDSEGTLANVSCDPRTGQCECVHPGITGRSCDRCLADAEGVFPSCYPCGECYQGWELKLRDASNQINSTFSQLHNLSLSFGDWSSDELESILFIVQQNISLSQDLYKSASNHINSTNQLKLDLLLLHASLNTIGQSVIQLANQLSDYSQQLNSSVDIFQNSSYLSAAELEAAVGNAAGRGDKLSQVFADFELRLNRTLTNLTIQQQMHRALRLAASIKIEELVAANVSLTANESIVSSLASALTDLMGELEKEKTTLIDLNSSLVSGGVGLETLSGMLSEVSTSLLELRTAVLASLNTAMGERTEVDSLSRAASTSRQNAQEVLTAITQHVANIEELQLDLERQWTLHNNTGRVLVNVSWSLERAHSLYTNISNSLLPDTTDIEHLLASIHQRDLTEEQQMMLTDKLEGDVRAADQYINKSLRVESEVAEIAELVESTLRDLSVAKLHINKSEHVLDSLLAGLHGEINHTLLTIHETLLAKSQQSSRLISQLDLFKYLSNQIRKCSDNSTQHLINLNVSLTQLEETSTHNEQILSEVSSSQSQLFMRLQMQAVATQKSQISLSESERKYERVSSGLGDKQRLLEDLIGEHNSNAERLSALEGKVEQAESRLMSLLDSFESGPVCEPQSRLDD